jgi:2-polyprenyl-6-methoxyphenol hydroxylase-like FAD-dependent oxidoreductase
MAGLTEEFRRHILRGGDAMRVLDKAGLIRYEHEGDGTRPEIERGNLRAILLASFPSHLIHRSATVTDIISVGGGRHEVTVTPGYSFTTDLLIGADGAWSRVRPVTSDAKPAYLGISFVETHLKKADQEYPEAGRLVGQGSMFALSDEKGLIAHRETSGDIRVYIALKADELWVSSGEMILKIPQVLKQPCSGTLRAGMTRCERSLRMATNSCRGESMRSP